MSKLVYIENEVYHNAKIKYYSNGIVSTTICNKAIFRDNDFEFINEPETVSKPQNKNNIPRDDSVSRAKKKVYDIYSSWDYFVTLTLSSDNLDRCNSTEVKKALQSFLRNMVQRYNLKYLLVPEYHKDGKSIHMHLLCSGDFKIVDSGTVLCPGYTKPVKLKTALKKCSDSSKLRIVYNLPQWSFGFSTAVRLQGDIENVVKYIVKYITKDCKKIFGNFYLAGGKDLIRNVPYKLDDIDFESVDLVEYKVDDIGLSFKYLNRKGVELDV